ncbi:hypothetical protein WN55_04857 [Dufourea novaeangliae]|uniref:Uncharacterized protein n=1 Tax=Dufourea novaeangliae TaxID=178035 RepID=A0A154PP63_DUFNO|nr:hypothetical protein WN55_04857 [Dufourea novaeangliae]
MIEFVDQLVVTSWNYRVSGEASESFFKRRRIEYARRKPIFPVEKFTARPTVFKEKGA